MAVERLHKVMANAGIASRRECEAMIAAGHVTVNGKVVTEMGVKVDPTHDQIQVDGEPLKPRVRSKSVYLMLYKPAGYLSVFNDERGRPGLEALVPSDTRLYPVGRLDADSEGLQLLTNDGELTLRLSHPRYEHAKTYLVLVDRIPSTETLAHFRRGIELEDGKTLPSEWRVLEKPPNVAPPADPLHAQGVWLQVTLREGRKRQIRRMAAAEKLFVRRLIRIGMGPLRLDRKLRPGQSRPLTGEELRLLNSPASEGSGRGPRRPADQARRPELGRNARPERAEPLGGRTGGSGRQSRPERDAEPGRSRPSADRPAEPGRRPQPDRGAASSRSRPMPDRSSEPGRRPPTARDPEPRRGRPEAGRSADRDRRPLSAGRTSDSGRRQASKDRGGSAGRRPPRERGAGSEQRSYRGRDDTPDRRRGPEASSAESQPATRREDRPADRPRGPRGGSGPRPAFPGRGQPARGRSPLRFQKPSRQGGPAQPGTVDRDARVDRQRPSQPSTQATGRRPRPEGRPPRSTGAPKGRRKP